MNLKAKLFEETRKQATQEKLSARMAVLEAKGTDKAMIGKDAMVKKLQAEIRQTKRRLAAVAAQEKLLAQKKDNKAQKEAAKKEAPAKAAKSKKEEAKPQKKEKKAKAKK